MRRWKWIVAGLVCFGLALTLRCESGPRLATWNIENYPRNARQVEGAFAMIEELDVQAVAVQEITDPTHFAAQARARLGDHWHLVVPQPHATPLQRVGLLVDTKTFKIDGVWVHDEVQIYPSAKPALEVRLVPRVGGRALRTIVVHLKATGTGIEIRKRQLQALQPILARAKLTGDRIALMGDFNSTSPQDRVHIESMAAATSTVWASRDLPCTAYWNRADGCIGSSLDQVVTSQAPAKILARGPCESEGCDRKDSCPTFHAEVSDHCPVVFELD